MKRSPFKIAMVVLAYLAAGAVVNVVVAAGCALWMPFDQPYLRAFDAVPRSMEKWVPQNWRATMSEVTEAGGPSQVFVEAREIRRLGVCIRELIIHRRARQGLLVISGRTPREEFKPDRVVVYRAGWPLACIEASSDLVSAYGYGDLLGYPTIDPPAAFRPVLDVPVAGSEVRVPPTPYRGFKVSNVVRNFIPLSPVWSGLIANTIVWALTLAVLVRGPRWFRGEIRMRRGLCRSCGYPIGVADRCTECGWVLPRWMIQMRMPGGGRSPLRHLPR